MPTLALLARVDAPLIRLPMSAVIVSIEPMLQHAFQGAGVDFADSAAGRNGREALDCARSKSKYGL